MSKHALIHQLQQLNHLLTQLDPLQFTQPIYHLGGATIGEHTRHILEILHCLLSGYNQGLIDYTNRDRNHALELDLGLALAICQNAGKNFDQIDKPLKLQIAKQQDPPQWVETSFARELVYQAEHAVHHLALIKTATIELKLNIIDEQFGVAESTIQYRSQQAAVQQQQSQI
ncbi:MAG: hypothetical protein EAZ62_04645 [Sphingobacteriia bacterium]|nr:MAG: hypothetical protein EAZ62_04645 [Sphingobacteriia bacterium]